ncbi:SOCS box domain-containing protein [Caerostris extrusa]|uniref:SOCS box domain-containing protein n=1 Tax=Caerostris extrusa TaxID=172846 RepID=A0AAV4TUI5_CAEEX|nr:SOCS box domain-containing protein [Caerostris extrusa]
MTLMMSDDVIDDVSGLETFKKLCFPIHPLFLSAAELLCWFFESERYWNIENPQRRTQHTYFIDKLALFCRNFKVLLLSTYNPHDIENNVAYILMKYSKVQSP